MRFGIHELLTKIVCARTVLPQVRGSWVMSSTLYVSARQQKYYLAGLLLNANGSRLLDLPSLTSFSAEETTRLVPGNPPPQILHKDLRRWKQEATPLCCEFAYALRTHITSLQPGVVDMSSDDEDAASSDNNDEFSLIPPPPGFQPVSIPPTNTMFTFLDPAGHQLIGHHILFKWPPGPRMAGALAVCPKGIVTRSARSVRR